MRAPLGVLDLALLLLLLVAAGSQATNCVTGSNLSPFVSQTVSDPVQLSFTGPADHNLSCNWTFCSTPSRLLVVRIDQLKTEASYDNVRVLNATGSELMAWSGNQTSPRDVSVPAQCATISFTTDDSIASDSFSISIFSVSCREQVFEGVCNTSYWSTCTIIQGIRCIDSPCDLSCLSNLLEVLDVVIITRSNVSRLNFGNITKVAKNVEITENAQLTAVDGSLRQVDGSLLIRRNPQLRSLSGLRSLVSVGWTLHVGRNNELESLAGLESLIIVGNQLVVERNQMLGTLQGLESLVSVSDFLHIFGNPMLTSVQGMHSLETVGGSLIVSTNQRLASLNGLEFIKRVSGLVEIYGNPALQSLSGLANVESVGAYIFIGSNSALTSIEMSSLTRVGGTLSIESNPTLLSISLDKLETVGGTLRLQSNGIESLAGLGRLQVVGDDFLVMFNGALKSTSGVESLRTVGDSVEFYGNVQLENLKGLASLTDVGGHLLLERNDALRSLQGLESLSTVGDWISLRGFPFRTLDALRSLRDVGGIFEISSNSQLQSLAGLQSLTRIGGDFSILDCPELRSLAGLESLVTIGGSFVVKNNSALRSLAGLEKLATVGDQLSLMNNPSLESACMPQLNFLGYFGVFNSNPNLNCSEFFEAVQSALSFSSISLSCPPYRSARSYACCSAGFAPATDGSCEECAAGRYCPAGTGPSPVQCPAGYVCPRGERPDLCFGGQYCAEGSFVSTECPPGFFCRNPSSREECPPGHFCPAGSVSPTPCSAGRYCDGTGRSYDGLLCFPGSFCPAASTDFSTLCPPGWFCPVLGAPQLCSAGRYCPISGSSTDGDLCGGGYSCPSGSTTRLLPCNPGHYCPSGSGPIPCSAGRFCASPGQSREVSSACTRGSFCPQGSASPHACPPGYFANSTGMSTCMPCPPGKYSTLVNSSVCADFSCPPGSMCPAGSAIASLCPAGRYSNVSGSTSCQNCAPGRAAVSEGSSACSDCGGNSFSSEGARLCFMCRPGQYRSGTSCVSCAAGTFSTTDDAEQCTPCSRNYQTWGFTSLNGSSSCARCPLGSYLPLGSVVCHLCEPGSARSAMDSLSCDTCPPGTYAETNGSSTCQQCPPGRFNDGGRSRFNSFPTSIRCGVCPQHTFSTSGSVSCYPCNLGQSFFTTTASSPVCVKCDVDKYLVASDDIIEIVDRLILNWSQGLESAFDFQRYESDLRSVQGCEPCPFGASCASGRPQASQGFWLQKIYAYHFSTLACSNPIACTSNGSCGENRVNPPSLNPLCARCSPGFQEVGGRCVPCESTNHGLVLLAFLLGFVFVLFYHRVSQTSSAPLAIFVFFVQSATLFIGDSSGGSGLLAILDSVLSLNFTEMAGDRCTLRMSDWQRMMSGFVWPTIALGQWFLLALASETFHRSCHSKRHRSASVEMSALPSSAQISTLTAESLPHWSRWARSLLALYLFTFNGLVETAFNILRCRNDSEEPVVYSFPQVPCTGQDYRTAFGVAVFVCVFQLAFVPAVLAFLIYRAAKPGASATLKHVTGPLTEPFEERASLAHPWILVRRTALVAVIVFMPEGRRWQMIVSSILCLVFVFVQMLVRPMKTGTENVAEALSLVLLTAMCVVLSGFGLPYSDGELLVLFFMWSTPTALLGVWVLFRSRNVIGSMIVVVRTFFARRRPKQPSRLMT